MDARDTPQTEHHLLTTPNDLSRGTQGRDPNVRRTAMRAVSVDAEPERGQSVWSERVTPVTAD